MNRWQKLCVCVVFILTMIITSWPVLNPHFFRVHDYTHAARIAEMERAFQDGQIPPRWSQNFGFGYGMPLFLFYAPLPYALAAGVYWLTSDLHITLAFLFIVPNIVIFWGSFVLAKKWYGWLGGLVTAVVITVAPYRALNLYVRGAVSELWGMMTYPWLLLASTLMIENKPKAGRQLIGWGSVLLLSHNLSALMFAPILVIWSIGYWLIQGIQKNGLGMSWSKTVALIARLAVVGFLILSVTAFYWLPALSEKSFTKVDRIFSGYFHYSQHFLYIRQFFWDNWGYGGSAWGPDDDISFFLGYGELVTLAVSGVVVVGLGIRNLRTKSKSMGWSELFVTFLGLGLFVVSIFFTLGRSQFIWDHLPPWQMIQFPWRWLGVSTIFLGLAVGGTIGLLSRFLTPKYVLAVASVLLIAVVANNSRYFKPEFFLDNFDSLYYSDANRIASDMSPVLNDYIPFSFPEPQTPPTNLVSINPPVSTDSVEQLQNLSQQKLVRVKVTQPSVVTWGVAAFPGWQAYLGNQKVDSQVDEQGHLVTSIPAGTNLLSLVFERTPIRLLADWWSVIGLVAFVSYAWWEEKYAAHS